MTSDVKLPNVIYTGIKRVSRQRTTEDQTTDRTRYCVLPRAYSFWTRTEQRLKPSKYFLQRPSFQRVPGEADVAAELISFSRRASRSTAVKESSQNERNLRRLRKDIQPPLMTSVQKVLLAGATVRWNVKGNFTLRDILVPAIHI